jgi:hypothetical protein
MGSLNYGQKYTLEHNNIQFQVHLFEEFVSNNCYLNIKMTLQSLTRVTNSLGEALKMVVITRAKFK